MTNTELTASIKIHFEDTHLIVLSKPSGLLSQGEIQGDENLVDYLRGYFGRNYVGLVHRLDRNTSGLMVVAKRTKSAQRLTEALQKGELDRWYLAWLIGTLPSPQKWSHCLLKDSKTNLVRVVPRGTPGGKESSLKVIPKKQAIFRGSPITLAEFQLETGRSHQIRVQSSQSGFPLLGDPKYGAKIPFPRLALHSHYLKFPHPMSKEVIEFRDPLPNDLEI